MLQLLWVTSKCIILFIKSALYSIKNPVEIQDKITTKNNFIQQPNTALNLQHQQCPPVEVLSSQLRVPGVAYVKCSDYKTVWSAPHGAPWTNRRLTAPSLSPLCPHAFSLTEPQPHVVLVSHTFPCCSPQAGLKITALTSSWPTYLHLDILPLNLVI